MAEVLDKVKPDEVFTSWEYKAIEPPERLKSMVPEYGIYVEGYANKTSKDLLGDVVAAYNWNQDTVDGYMKNGYGTLLFNHNENKAVGKILEAEAMQDGLFVRGYVSKSWSDSWMLEEGYIKGFSIGYLTNWEKSLYEPQTNTFFLDIAALYEISITPIPANSDSLITSIKGLIPKASPNTKTMNGLFKTIKDLFGVTIPENATEQAAIEALQGIKSLKAEIDADELKTMVATAVAELGLKKIDDSAFAEKSVLETLKGTVEAQAKMINDLAAELAGKKLNDPKPNEGNAPTALSTTEKAFGKALKASVKA